MPEVKQFTTIKEAAEITGLSECFFRRGVRNGSVPYIRSGVKYLVRLPQFLAQLDAQQGEEAHADA